MDDVVGALGAALVGVVVIAYFYATLYGPGAGVVNSVVSTYGPIAVLVVVAVAAYAVFID